MYMSTISYKNTINTSYSYTSTYFKYNYKHHTLIQVRILNISKILIETQKTHHTLIQVCILNRFTCI